MLHQGEHGIRLAGGVFPLALTFGVSVHISFTFSSTMLQ